jgi:hypothetical protein
MLKRLNDARNFNQVIACALLSMIACMINFNQVIACALPFMSASMIASMIASVSLY